MRRPTLVLAAALTLAAAGLDRESPERSRVSAPATRAPSDAAEAALARGLSFLLDAQRDDGTWRSEPYPFLADGTALTLPVTKALLMARSPATEQALARAVAALSRLVDADGRLLASDLAYPVYTAALAVTVLSRLDDVGAHAARDAWLRLLREHQLVETLGWTPDESSHGGWGLSRVAPRRELVPRAAADLSSTLFAVGALRLAGVPADDPAVVAAAGFVERCQNFDGEWPEASDGGFFLSPTDGARNKAGPVDPLGMNTRCGPCPPRFRSYGSATADGLRALLRCGYGTGHPRVVAARRWLEQHFDPDRNPGAFLPAREVERAGSYFAWCWSFAHAMRALGQTELATDAGPRPWAPPLVTALLQRQRPDGSWRNTATTLFEDDPLVATPFALAALGMGRWFLPETETDRSR